MKCVSYTTKDWFDIMAIYQKSCTDAFESQWMSLEDDNPFAS